MLAKSNVGFFLEAHPIVSHFYMKSLFFFVFAIVFVLTGFCSKDSNSEIEKVFISDDLQISKLNPNGKEYDIIDILNTSSPKAKSVQHTHNAGLKLNNSDDLDLQSNEKSSSVISDALSHSLDVNRDWEAEKALKKLEQIVGKLEDGDISLEDSVKSFEEGIGLVKECQKQLSEAELKVKKLLDNGETVDLED